MNIISALTLEIKSLISRLEAQKKETRYWRDRCIKAESRLDKLIKFHTSSVERLVARINELKESAGINE